MKKVSSSRSFAMVNHRLPVPDIENVFEGKTVSGLSEWQLLARYLEDRDEIAFEALVARHGPMVMGTCRRMLGRRSDVEDAFQATFLVLVRRARSLGPRDAIGPWLHGVAARVSMRARCQAARQRRLEPIASEVAAVPASSAHVDAEMASILDQEVNRLPAKYRSPIVLCYLQGHTHDEAARQLNWPLGTVKGRLHRARDLLRSRLMRRGIAPATALLSAGFAREAGAALDREFLEQTVGTCMKVTPGQVSIEAVSVSIASLVKGALSAMILDKLKWAGVALVASGLAFTGAVVVARQETGRPENEPARANVATVSKDAGKTAETSLGIDADVEKATALGIERVPLDDLQKRLVQAARRDWTTTLDDFRTNRASLDRVYQASRRLMEAEDLAQTSGADQVAADGHLERMRQLARLQDANPSRTDGQAVHVAALAAEAELWRAKALTKAPTGGKSQNTNQQAEVSRRAHDSGQAEGQVGLIGPLRCSDDARSQRVIARLEELVLMQFPDETPLGDLIKHIKDATKSSAMPSGLPIYVDPLGLQEADKTLNSTVMIDLEGIPLRRTLQLALAQLDLVYFIEDGIVFITSEGMAKTPLSPAAPARTPLTEKIDRAARGELTIDEMKDLIEMIKTQGLIKEIREGSDEPIWGGVGPDPRIATDQAKQNKELVESLIKEVHNLVEALKEERKSKASKQ
jgi:RNA polymerase sigma factor (sigma-70 family)